ncbi:MAG: hypothetical protein AAF604_22315 [Acidobacteriota bacterium]
MNTALAFSDLPAKLRRRLSNGRDLLRRHRDHGHHERFATGSAGFDRLLAGPGLVRGEMTELIGHRSSGRFSLLLTALAETTRRGEAAAFVDLGDGLDPRQLAALGGDLERLLWLRPRTLKEALAGTEAVLDGAFPLVVLDLGEPPIPGGRGSEAFWLRLARAAQRHRSAFLVSSPYRASGTAAATVLTARRGRGQWGSPRQPVLAGLSSQLRVDKGELPHQQESLRLRVPEAPSLPQIPGPIPAPAPAPEASPLRPTRPSRLSAARPQVTESAASSAGCTSGSRSSTAAARPRRVPGIFSNLRPFAERSGEKVGLAATGAE